MQLTIYCPWWWDVNEYCDLCLVGVMWIATDVWHTWQPQTMGETGPQPKLVQALHSYKGQNNDEVWLDYVLTGSYMFFSGMY